MNAPHSIVYTSPMNDCGIDAVVLATARAITHPADKAVWRLHILPIQQWGFETPSDPLLAREQIRHRCPLGEGRLRPVYNDLGIGRFWPLDRAGVPKMPGLVVRTPC